VEIADADALAARLQVWLAPLRRFVQASGAIARFTDELGDDLSGWIDRDRFAREAESAARMAAVLVGMADRPTLDLGKVIVEVDEDVLGAYAYDRQERSPYRGTHAAEIRLYWGAIGLLARVLDVTVEGLTVLVLAHEFAHAYTHLGFDRQGERWSGEAYAATDHVLKEALAQYWAWVALKKLEDRLPDGLAAYERVLPKQPPAYHAHGPWITRFRPDTIASALVRMRPKGAVHYEAFVEELERIEGPGGVALDLSEG
jgi:predicted Zn-dependent protease with MMP-like domain